MNLLNNQNGHGYVPSGKDAVKILGVLITAPLWLPFFIIKEKIEKHIEKKKEKEKQNGL